ncbi:hypothetical protein DFS34DRAFT_643475 [Phlyctochytrium arcticum]|nr:hypothetical protein DFS34DRAFT_643475 [Phlyctochytrium arcticum]
MLKIFYERFFPFQEVYRWLSYGNVQKNYFANREWSFTLANEIYVRFQSFKDAQALRDEVVKAVPVKMDIGAVYNIAPKEKKSVSAASFKPMERELVFDIDMTDYDEIRTCCSGGSVCHKCWEFMTVAIKILDRALREDFGFKHLLWVYSGRRGVHCWVSDSRARKLTGDQRRAIVSFLEVIKGGAEQGAGRRVNLGRTLHPSLGAAQKVVEEYFERTVLKGMNCMRTPEQIEKLVGFVQDADVIARFQQEMASRPGPTSLQTWQILVSLLNAPGKKSSGKFFPPNTERDIQFLYIYPRLDSHVSIGLNHLLKAPFCVHPKTGRVCVPINPATCESFDPIGSVGVEELVEAGDGKGLAPHISYFRQFLNGLGEEIRMERGVDLTF